MFDHVQIKVSNLDECRAFYEAVLAALGYRIVFEVEGVVGIGASTHDMFEIRQAGGDAPLSSAAHVAFAAPSKQAVDDFHEIALKYGARDNGAPGPRPEYEPGYYAAFVIDPNGHNLEAVFMDNP